MRVTKSLLWDWMHLIRAEHALMTFFAIIISEMVVTQASLPPAFPEFWRNLGFPIFAFFSALGPALVTAASFILNDVQGFASDHANKRFERPLVRGTISKTRARNASIVLFALGLAASFFVNAYAFLITLGFSILAVAYDPVLKKKPFLGNLYIAGSMAIPFVYGNVAASVSAQTFTIPPQLALDDSIVVFSLVAFVVGLGRELIITLRDVHGDRAVGALTLPMVIGARNTVRLSSFFIISAVALSMVPLLQQFYVYYLFFISGTDALLLFTIYKINKSHDTATLKACRNYTLLALIIGLFAFSTLAFK
ncbi:MAG: geranylgeranylglycerol-phosphate geranylgeranyltransferase [Candidatus Micrarchaeia archaeon]|jgi:geranylgeranylglycerol-phosphate geranylgeranyltransferase